MVKKKNKPHTTKKKKEVRIQRKMANFFMDVLVQAATNMPRRVGRVDPPKGARNALKNVKVRRPPAPQKVSHQLEKKRAIRTVAKSIDDTPLPKRQKISQPTVGKSIYRSGNDAPLDVAGQRVNRKGAEVNLPATDDPGVSSSLGKLPDDSTTAVIRSSDNKIPKLNKIQWQYS